MDAALLRPGLAVTWMRSLRKGWFAFEPVPATVVRLAGQRVLIAAELRTSGTKQVWVRPANLRERNN